MPLRFLRRSLLPIAIFATVMGLHYVWVGRSCEACVAETLPNGQVVCYELSGWAAYVESKSYYLGYSCGLSLACVVGLLVEVPVMLSVCRVCNASRGWYQRGLGASAD